VLRDIIDQQQEIVGTKAIVTTCNNKDKENGKRAV
jgi:hypothetical protein